MSCPDKASAIIKFNINVSDEQFKELKQLAHKNHVSPEELLRTNVEKWLSYSQNDFDQAARYILEKNAEFYRLLE